MSKGMEFLHLRTAVTSVLCDCVSANHVSLLTTSFYAANKVVAENLTTVSLSLVLGSSVSVVKLS